MDIWQFSLLEYLWPKKYLYIKCLNIRDELSENYGLLKKLSLADDEKSIELIASIIKLEEEEKPSIFQQLRDKLRSWKEVSVK